MPGQYNNYIYIKIYTVTNEEIMYQDTVWNFDSPLNKLYNYVISCQKMSNGQDMLCKMNAHVIKMCVSVVYI